MDSFARSRQIAKLCLNTMPICDFNPLTLTLSQRRGNVAFFPLLPEGEGRDEGIHTIP